MNTDNLKAKDRSRKKFRCMPEYLDFFVSQRIISFLDAYVYVILLDYVHSKTGECFPSISKIAIKLGIPRQSVQRSVGVLVRVGLISSSLKTIGGVNSYVFKDVDLLIAATRDTNSTLSVDPDQGVHQGDAGGASPRCRGVHQGDAPLSIVNDIERIESSTTTGPENLKILKTGASPLKLVEKDLQIDEGIAIDEDSGVKRRSHARDNGEGTGRGNTPRARDDAREAIAGARETMVMAMDYGENLGRSIEQVQNALKQPVLNFRVGEATTTFEAGNTPSLCGALAQSEAIDDESKESDMMFTKEMQCRGLKKKGEKKDRKNGFGEKGPKKNNFEVCELYNLYVKTCSECAYPVPVEPTMKQALKMGELVKQFKDVQLIGRVVEFAVRNWTSRCHIALPKDMADRVIAAPVLEIIFTPVLFQNWLNVMNGQSIEKPTGPLRHSGIQKRKPRAPKKDFDFSF